MNHSEFHAETKKSSLAWYALRVRARSELQVGAVLEAKGLQSYVATRPCTTKWADRTKVSQISLFPGYVFSRFDVNVRLPVLTTPGVTQVLGVGKVPVPIPDSEMENLFRLDSVDVPQVAVALPAAGEKVVITRGPLLGVEGILIRAHKQSRLLVGITLLMRAVSVDMEQSWVSATGDGAECARVA